MLCLFVTCYALLRPCSPYYVFFRLLLRLICALLCLLVHGCRAHAPARHCPPPTSAHARTQHMQTHVASCCVLLRRRSVCPTPPPSCTRSVAHSHTHPAALSHVPAPSPPLDRRRPWTVSLGYAPRTHTHAHTHTHIHTHTHRSNLCSWTSSSPPESRSRPPPVAVQLPRPPPVAVPLSRPRLCVSVGVGVCVLVHLPVSRPRLCVCWSRVLCLLSVWASVYLCLSLVCVCVCVCARARCVSSPPVPVAIAMPPRHCAATPEPRNLPTMLRLIAPYCGLLHLI